MYYVYYSRKYIFLIKILWNAHLSIYNLYSLQDSYKPFICSSIQSVKCETLVYTPGLLAPAHPAPHDVTPCKNQGFWPFIVAPWDTRGPPESPWMIRVEEFYMIFNKFMKW